MRRKETRSESIGEVEHLTRSTSGLLSPMPAQNQPQKKNPRHPQATWKNPFLDHYRHISGAHWCTHDWQQKGGMSSATPSLGRLWLIHEMPGPCAKPWLGSPTNCVQTWRKVAQATSISFACPLARWRRMLSGLMSLCRTSQLLQCLTASSTWRNSPCTSLPTGMPTQE